MITVLVDDLRSFADGRDCIVARTAHDAVPVIIHALTEEPFEVDELWLDHDLGYGAGSGMDVVHWLCNTGHPTNDQWRPEYATILPVKKIYVHTSNPPAGERMVATLRDAGYNVERHWDSSLEPTWRYVPVEAE